MATILTTAGELVGLLLASDGLVGESFAQLAEPRAFGEGRYGEGPYGGTSTTAPIIALAKGIGLLPRDGTLTLTERQANATRAIVGTAIAMLALFAELILALLS